MKKFKCVASKRGEEKSGKKIKKQVTYESTSFVFSAPNFKAAVTSAEKIAKRLMVFNSLKVSEV